LLPYVGFIPLGQQQVGSHVAGTESPRAALESLERGATKRLDWGFNNSDASGCRENLMEAHHPLPRFSVHWIVAGVFFVCVIAPLRSGAATPLPETFLYRARVTDSGGQTIAGAVVEVYCYPEQGRDPRAGVGSHRCHRR